MDHDLDAVGPAALIAIADEAHVVHVVGPWKIRAHR